MVKIEGLFNTAFCYTPALEDAARAQIQSVCDQKEFSGCKIRIMPDVHAGKGCTIGTTMTIRDKIVPGMVGVDIGCGMETVELPERLDAPIRKWPRGASRDSCVECGTRCISAALRRSSQPQSSDEKHRLSWRREPLHQGGSHGRWSAVSGSPLRQSASIPPRRNTAYYNKFGQESRTASPAFFPSHA